MTTTSMERPLATVVPTHFNDDDPPSKPLPEIEPFGDRAEIEAAKEEELTAKFDEYAGAAEAMVAHHDWQRNRYDDAHQHYEKIFSRMETLETIAKAAEAVAPGFDILEEFELFKLEGSAAKALTLFNTTSVHLGVLVASVSAFKAVRAASSARAAVALEKAQFRPGGPLSRNLRSASARAAGKMVGGIAAVVGVIGAGAGIWALYENAAKRREFLEDGVEGYQNWFASTMESHDALKAAADDMEAQITELMVLLDQDTPEGVEAALGDTVVAAGEIQTAMQVVTRMLCATTPLAVTDVASFTGLPEATVQRRKDMIDQDPSICNI